MGGNGLAMASIVTAGFCLAAALIQFGRAWGAGEDIHRQWALITAGWIALYMVMTYRAFS